VGRRNLSYFWGKPTQKGNPVILGKKKKKKKRKKVGGGKKKKPTPPPPPLAQGLDPPLGLMVMHWTLDQGAQT